MHFLAVLNRDGGTLRTTDLADLEAKARGIFETAGHTLEVAIVSGDEIPEALKKAAHNARADIVIAGGGDGTISAAAAALMKGNKVLAALPAGTMNLFARGLGIPLDLEEALTTFATGVVHEVDMASANDIPFVHQFSIGMHADLVERREALSYSSRLGKMRASLQAALQTIWNPPRMRVRIDLAGSEIVALTSGIGVTNNLFGDGIFYAEIPDRGELGLYVTRARRRSDVFRLLIHLAFGRWRTNPQVEIHRSERATLTLLRSHRKFRCAIDGELHALQRETEIVCHPKALKVLIPAEAMTSRDSAGSTGQAPAS